MNRLNRSSVQKRPLRHTGLLLLLLLLAFSLLAGCASGQDMQPTAEEAGQDPGVEKPEPTEMGEEADKMQPEQETDSARAEAIRAIDAQAPDDFKTATFAMG